MSVLGRWIQRGFVSERDAQFPALSLDDWISMLTVNGWPVPTSNQYSLGQQADEIAADFQGIVQGALRGNGVIWACMVARMYLFAEMRFQFQALLNGQPGKLFGTQALRPLEKPWSGGTTSDLLNIVSLDIDLAGNAFVARGAPSLLDKGGAAYSLRRLQPDWVTIVGGSQSKPRSKHPLWEWDVEVIGYIYHPGGRNSGEPTISFMANEVAHIKDVPDPTAKFRGMSWVSPIIRETMADSAATTHKLKFFEQGATVNTVVSLDKDVGPKQFREFVEAFEEEHAGVMNAYKTVYLGGGADVTLIGSNMQQSSFKEVQGAGETRICAAARIPPILVGLSEGLQASTYSNYGLAKRAFGDMTLRPKWSNTCGSLETIIDMPLATRLWYDEKGIPFLREDAADEAKAQQARAETIASLVQEGFTPESAVAAVVAGDLTLLVHSGLVSVQLQPPGAEINAPKIPGALPEPKSTNGKSTTKPQLPPKSQAK